jgi:hypothetical protein
LEVDEQREKVGEQRRPAVSVWWSFTRLDSEERKASLQNRREQVKEARHPLSFLVFLLIIFFSLNNFFLLWAKPGHWPRGWFPVLFFNLKNHFY